MNASWFVFIGVLAGLVLKLRAAPLPLLVASGLWIAGDTEGRFVNHSGYGDNFGAEALLGATIFCAIGWLGVPRRDHDAPWSRKTAPLEVRPREGPQPPGVAVARLHEL
jgi:hypothetical protein